ncbi:LuxR C-terminal-related transcriptional regulator [Peterkaempfera sp. SMS 1(5)a]|uniref:helix-turn-helix transcriptional regulator n=1 Tax=Peterkaempfera podocarpi TaxID=3232308 RepID=UPI00366FF381
MTIPISVPEALLRETLAAVAGQHDMPITIRQVETLARAAVEILADHLDTAPPRTPLGVAIPPVQLAVLIGICNGLESAEIAARMCRSEDTVKTHLRRLFARLGVNNRAHAASVALAAGVVPAAVVRVPRREGAAA